jgi:hypothetical protein
MEYSLIECRCCSIGGKSFWNPRTGSYEAPAPGWGRIARIDGPDLICPECREDPVAALDSLKLDGYENAYIVEWGEPSL